MRHGNNPPARGFGIGQRLLEEIQSFAIAHHCKRLFLSTTPFLDRARLYETFGFQHTREGPCDLFGTPLFTMEKFCMKAPPSDLPRTN